MPNPDGPAEPDARLKVLYIAGSGRSGSTILCQILGEIDGFFCGGELSDFWDRYLGENRLCACGVEFRACKVWSRVLQRGMPGIGPAEAFRIARLHMGVGRTQHLPFLLLPPLRGIIQQRLTEYRTRLADLYCAIGAETGCSVLLDSSKFPSYGWILGRVPGVELFVVHLIRDPRAVAYSWARRRPSVHPDQNIETPRFGPASSSLRWLARNILTARLWRSDPEHYFLLRYEDFVADPRAAVERILGFVRVRSASVPFVGSHRVRLGENHIVWGNRSRFLRGMKDIVPDTEWRTRIGLLPRIIIEAITWPWMLRYGYSLRLPTQTGIVESGDAG